MFPTDKNFPFWRNCKPIYAWALLMIEPLHRGSTCPCPEDAPWNRETVFLAAIILSAVHESRCRATKRPRRIIALCISFKEWLLESRIRSVWIEVLCEGVPFPIVKSYNWRISWWKRSEHRLPGEIGGGLPSVSPERLCVWRLQNQGERDAGRLPPDLRHDHLKVWYTGQGTFSRRRKMEKNGKRGGV